MARLSMEKRAKFVTPRRTSVFLLTLVQGLIVLDPGDTQAGHTGAIDRALPAGKLLDAEAVPLADLVHGQKTTTDSGHDLGLAANHPTGRARGRKRIHREGFA